MTTIVEQRKWVTATIGADHYKTNITLSDHNLVADEPESLGGTDLGPSPGDFLRMSLASCTAITLRMYADRKKFAVEKIQVHVYSDEVEGKTIFRATIDIKGTLDDEQIKRMGQIAKMC